MELREPQTKSRLGRQQLTQSWVVERCMRAREHLHSTETERSWSSHMEIVHYHVAAEEIAKGWVH